MVTRTPLNVTLYVHCLSRLFTAMKSVLIKSKFDFRISLCTWTRHAMYQQYVTALRLMCPVTTASERGVYCYNKPDACTAEPPHSVNEQLNFTFLIVVEASNVSRRFKLLRQKIPGNIFTETPIKF